MKNSLMYSSWNHADQSSLVNSQAATEHTYPGLPLVAEIISEVQMKDASTLEVYDKEIQCRFSISKVGSGRNSLGRP